MLIKVNAGNDTNGNPRRGWIHTDTNGVAIAFYDEGFDNGGDEFNKGLYRTEPTLNFTLEIPFKQYRELKKMGK